MNIKKIFSGIVSAVMLFSFSAQYIVRNETAMASVSKGSSTFIENEPTVIADSSVGSFIANSMKSEDITEVGEQESGIQYSGDYGIEDITYDPDANTLSLSTWQDEGCTAVVGFYSDDGKRMYTSEKVVISQGSETTTLRPDNSKLPDSFLIKAYLVNEQLMPLCNCYVYNKMTKDMQEILAKTVDDFDPSLVVQIDETDDTNNFYVLNDDTKLIDSTSETNTIVSADYETGTYVFTNIDDSLRGLSKGDIFSASTDEGVIAAEIKTITIDGDTATIVGTSDEEELFQFIKINTSELDPSLLGTYTVDMSEADECVSLSDKSFDETPIPEDNSTDTTSINANAEAEQLYAPAISEAPLTVSPKTEEQVSAGIAVEPTFTIAENKPDAKGNGIKGKFSFVVSVPIEIKVEFYSSLNYCSFEIKGGFGFKAKGSASVEGEFKIPLGYVDFPVAGVLHLGVTPNYVIRGSVEASITFQKGFSAGCTWDTNTKELKKNDGLRSKVVEDSIELNLEASLFIGIELEFKAFIINKETFSLKFPLDVGLSIKATVPPIASAKFTDAFGDGQTFEEAFLHYNSEELPDELYNPNCDVFVEIDSDFLVSLSAELKALDNELNPLRDKMKIKAELLEARKNIGRFYFAVYYDETTGEIEHEFGRWEDLANKDYIRYKTSVKVYGKYREPLVGAAVNCDSSKEDVITDKSGEVIYYLSPDQYVFTCNMNGEYRTKYTEVINESRTVSFMMGDSIYDPDDPTDPNSPEAIASLQFLTCEENDDGLLTITDCKKKGSTKITIPRAIDGKPVTSIGSHAFSHCYDLTSVTIPDSVTSIGKEAFACCSALRTINIPDGVTEIEEGTFFNCIRLNNISLPDSLTTIGDEAFGACYGLTSITIPESVKGIGYSAFYNCNSLTGIEVDDNNDDFSSLNGVLYNKDKTVLICCPAGTKSTAITIPKSVTSIEKWAFGYCTSLTAVTISGNVTEIGDAAFYNCSSLTNITIPGGVAKIEDDTFTYCTSLESITILNPDCEISDRKTTICNVIDDKGNISFNGSIYGYTNSTAQEYAEGYGYNFEPIDTVPVMLSAKTLMSAMKTAENTSEVECTFKQDVIKADIYNFYVFADENAADLLAADNLLYMTQVQVMPDALSVEIPYILGSDYPDRTEKLVGFEAADNGFVLDDTQGNDTVSLVDYTGPASDITIPDSVTSIGSGAFEGCGSLVSVTVPSSVTGIGESAFAGCENLVSVTILNPDCQIYDSATTLFNDYDNETGEYRFNGTIYGYTDSTAHAYAEKYGHKFESIGSSTTPKPEKYKFGDPNGSGKIDSSDASFVLGVYAILATGGDARLEEEQIKAADVNKDGKIDSKDASVMLAYYSYISTGGTDDLETFLKS